MNELEDIKLRMLLQDIKLESPDANFSTRVMDKILKENEAIEKIKSERILGRGFWIILALFIILLGITWIASSSGAETGGILEKWFQEANSSTNGYNTLLGKLGLVPASIAGILIASSVLLFIERFISSNLEVFSNRKVVP